MEDNIEVFHIQTFISIIEIDNLPQREILLRLQLDELPHMNITTLNTTEGINCYNIYKGIEFLARLECFSAFKVLPVYIFLSNQESQVICACGFDLGPLVTDSYRKNYQNIQGVETYQVPLQLQDRYNRKYGYIHVEFSVGHFSTDLNNIFCYEDLPSNEIVEEPSEQEEMKPEPTKKTEKKVNKRKFPRVNPRAADLYLLNLKYLDTKCDLINQVRDLENQVKRIETSRRRKIYKEKQAKKALNDPFTSEYSYSGYSTSSASSTVSQKKKPKTNKSNQIQEFPSTDKKTKAGAQKGKDNQQNSQSKQPIQAQTEVPHLQIQVPHDKPQVRPIQTQSPVINKKQDSQPNSARSKSSHSSKSSKSSKSSVHKIQDISSNVTQDLKDSLGKTNQSISGQSSTIEKKSKIESSTNSGMEVIDDVVSNLSHSSHSSHISKSSHSSHTSISSINSHKSNISNNSKSSKVSKTSKTSKSSKGSISNILIDSKSGLDNPDIISENFSSSSHATNAETTTTKKDDDSIGDISSDILGSDLHLEKKSDIEDNISKKSMSSISSKSGSSKKSSKSSAHENKNEKINIDSDFSSILKGTATNDTSSLGSDLKAELGLTSSNHNISEINSTSKKDTDKKSVGKTEPKSSATATTTAKDDESDSIDKEINDNLDKKSESTVGTDILSILSD